MPISRVISGDVFDVSRVAKGEKPVTIICGTNHLGNNKRDGSVANQIGKKFATDFLSFPEGEKQMGEIYMRHGQIAEVPARFVGIVCNEVESTLNRRSDWTQAPAGLEAGLQAIYDDATLTPSTQKVQAAIASMREQISRLDIQDGPAYLQAVKRLTEDTEGQTNPISRIVLIGSGESGVLNQASIADILTVMHNSPVNLHLYLLEAALQQQVAKVIPLFPALAKVEAFDEYRREKIIRVA